MGNSYKLTWRPREKRWRKKYKGNEYYFPAPEGKLKSYECCYQEWQRLKAEIDLGLKEPHEKAWAAFIDRLIDEQEKVKDSGNTLQARMAWEFFQVMVNRAQRFMEQGEEFPGVPGKPFVMKRVKDKKGKPVDDGIPAPWETSGVYWQEKSIGANVQRFLGGKRQQAERGDLSRGRHEVLRSCLESFAEFVGPASPVESIRSPMLTRYRDHLQKRVDDKEFSPAYARNHLQVLRQFVKWCWEQELLEIPRVLRGREFTITVPTKKVDVFSDTEIREILGCSPEATKLHLLLMLNCGMTQQDIADLRHEEVDWREGRVTRKRSKTRKNEFAPEVSYKLWPKVFGLLKKHRSKHPELVLTNRPKKGQDYGGPLKCEKNTGGKYQKIDNIHTAYNRVIRKLANRKENPVQIKKPLKLLRKTAASKLGEHSEYSRFAQYFLGHSPRTVADKHYVKPSGEQFDRAIVWLGEALGIGSK